LAFLFCISHQIARAGAENISRRKFEPMAFDFLAIFLVELLIFGKQIIESVRLLQYIVPAVNVGGFHDYFSLLVVKKGLKIFLRMSTGIPLPRILNLLFISILVIL